MKGSACWTDSAAAPAAGMHADAEIGLRTHHLQPALQYSFLLHNIIIGHHHHHYHHRQ
jgi:hypothetical protein